MSIFRIRQMTPAQVSRWERTRKKGRARYVLVNGMLCWGGFMTVGMTAIQRLLHPEIFDIVRNLKVNAMVFVIGGVLFGLWTWHTTERAYAITLH